MTHPFRLGTALALALLVGATPAAAEDVEERPALTFDEVNTPFEEVVAKATAAKRPIFIDFFADG